MSDITVSTTAQRISLLALLAVIGGLVALQAPEIKRYLKMRDM